MAIKQQAAGHLLSAADLRVSFFGFAPAIAQLVKQT